MKITGAATVLGVSNLEASLKFFTTVLGFREEFRAGEYAGVERDNCMIHLSQAGNPNTGAPGSGSVYVFCDEVDEFFGTLRDRNVAVDAPPKDYPCGMRDFCIGDPDGNRISFGCPAKTSCASVPKSAPD